MKKIVVSLLLIVILFVVCFLPFTKQKSIIIKAPFYNVYQQLAKPENWKKWRNDLQQIQGAYSTKISKKKIGRGFKISYDDLKIDVNPVDGYSFKINEINKNKTFEYSFTVVPGKQQDETIIILKQRTSTLNYILNKIKGKPFSQTHINDFKNFMESVSLYYGYDIVKSKVIDTDIIVLRKTILAKNKFKEALKSISVLKDYINSNGLKQTQPFIAQFFTKYNDSIQLNIGIPINRKILAKKPIDFMEMPNTGNIYTIQFHGKFMDRSKVYAAAQQYFNDKHISIPILPFETYFDNKVPQNDTDQVNIQINFPTF
jgi:effector-binding domain-containing protein